MDGINKKIKRRQMWFWVFIIVGLLGLLEVSTQAYIIPDNSDMGVVALAILLFFGLFLPAIVASSIMVVADILLGFSFIWLIVAWAIHKGTTRIKEGREKGLK